MNSDILRYLAGAGLALHGLIHLMGLVAYWPLGEIKELPYKTALLQGQWEVGKTGMQAFSVVWLIAAIGFVVAGAGLVADQGWARTVIVAVAVLSLVITVLDWDVARWGALINVVILIAAIVVPRMR